MYTNPVFGNNIIYSHLFFIIFFRRTRSSCTWIIFLFSRIGEYVEPAPRTVDENWPNRRLLCIFIDFPSCSCSSNEISPITLLSTVSRYRADPDSRSEIHNRRESGFFFFFCGCYSLFNSKIDRLRIVKIPPGIFRTVLKEFTPGRRPRVSSISPI